MGAERLFGWPAEAIIGEPAALLWTDEDRAAGADLAELRRVAALGETSAEHYRPRRDGSLVWVACRTSAVSDGGRLVGYAKVARDATAEHDTRDALQASEDTLRTSEARLAAREQRALRSRDRLSGINDALHDRLAAERAEVRRLADAFADAVTDEQRRIAAILHDDLQQLLVGASLRLQVLRMRATDDTLHAEIDATAQILTDALATTRTLTSRIVPPDVVSARIDRSFAWLAGNVADVYGLHVDLDFDCADDASGAPLAGHERLLLFQAARELLFNVAKHAGTDRARVSCYATPAVITITVEDDGVGIPDDATGGYGIADIHRRLAAAGGTLTTRRKEGGGTRAVVRLLRMPDDAPDDDATPDATGVPEPEA